MNDDEMTSEERHLLNTILRKVSLCETCKKEPALKLFSFCAACRIKENDKWMREQFEEVAEKAVDDKIRTIQNKILELEKKSKRIFAVGAAKLGSEFYYRGGKLEAYREILDIINREAKGSPACVGNEGEDSARASPSEPAKSCGCGCTTFHGEIDAEGEKHLECANCGKAVKLL